MDARLSIELQDEDGEILDSTKFELWIGHDIPVKIVSIRWEGLNLVLTLRSLIPKPGTSKEG